MVACCPYGGLLARGDRFAILQPVTSAVPTSTGTCSRVMIDTELDDSGNMTAVKVGKFTTLTEGKNVMAGRMWGFGGGLVLERVVAGMRSQR